MRGGQTLTVGDGALVDGLVIAFVRDRGSLALRHQPRGGGQTEALDQQPAARPGAAGGTVMLLSRASIRQKLAAMLMLTCSVVLVSASIAYVVWDYYRFRNDMRTDLATQAELVLDNTAAALAFNDQEAADETLTMLSINSHVRLACLYSRDRPPVHRGSFRHDVGRGTLPRLGDAGLHVYARPAAAGGATDAGAEPRRDGLSQRRPRRARCAAPDAGRGGGGHRAGRSGALVLAVVSARTGGRPADRRAGRHRPRHRRAR